MERFDYTPSTPLLLVTVEVRYDDPGVLMVPEGPTLERLNVGLERIEPDLLDQHLKRTAFRLMDGEIPFLYAWHIFRQGVELNVARGRENAVLMSGSVNR